MKALRYRLGQSVRFRQDYTAPWLSGLAAVVTAYQPLTSESWDYRVRLPDGNYYRVEEQDLRPAIKPIVLLQEPNQP